VAKGSTNKLNQLQQLPDWAIVDAAWLEQHGYSSSLRSQYVKAGWLCQPAPRTYRRSSSPLTWRQVITSLQTFLGYPLTVGGRTALEEEGYGHYLGERAEVHLYGPKKPPWLMALQLNVQFQWHNSRRLFPDDLAPAGNGRFADKRDAILPGGFMVSAAGLSWPLRLSSMERAFLELLDELPTHESFHQVDMLAEGLTNLSPRRLQLLLESCRSIKMKRLFFFFARRHCHAWLGKLDRATINLGSGKRVVAKGGKLDPEYQITVPEDLFGVP
jgi:hypothetical protein